MRKTFVVGKLTQSSARILVETDGRPTPALVQLLRITARAEAQQARLPDPLTLH